MDDTLGWRLEVLGRRNIDPERLVLLAVAEGPLPRGAALLCDMLVWSAFFSTLSRMLPSPAGEGNCVSLNSDEAESMLECRSSKLAEVKKSNVEVDWPERAVSPCRSYEGRVWFVDEDAESIGTSGTRLPLLNAGGIDEWGPAVLLL